MANFATCPGCDSMYIRAAVFNQRNSKYTILPLDEIPNFERDYPNRFAITNELADTVDILGEYAGIYKVAVIASGGNYIPHSPSHFLEVHTHE